MKSWKGKRVLITGGAAGIGRALAERLAPTGAHLLLADRDREPLAAAVEALRAAGATVEGHVLDVTDGSAILRARDEIHAAGGPIDVLVNNAGVVFGGAFLSVPLERHLTTFGVNTVGLVAMTHAFLPDLIGRADAHLVNLASAAGLVGLPMGSTYAASKWAVIGFSESIRLELARLGHEQVKVTTVCPLFVSTGLFEGARPPRTTSMLTPTRLAREIVEAVEQDQPFLLTPWLVKLTPLLKGLLPVRWADALSSLLGATRSMEHWKGRTGAPARARASRQPRVVRPGATGSARRRVVRAH